MNNYLNVKWKTENCTTNDCWCKIIVPINSDDMDCIIPSGIVSAEIAEYIVKLHNLNLDKITELCAETKLRQSLNNAKTIKTDYNALL